MNCSENKERLTQEVINDIKALIEHQKYTLGLCEEKIKRMEEKESNRHQLPLFNSEGVNE